MTICKWFAYPDLFITFTCNPKWPKIVRFVAKRGLRPEDRSDILCRVFKIKLNELIRDLKDRNIFGRAKAVVYTIEFQKRGLPHAHILLFLHREEKFPKAADVDKIISVEIPDPIKDPALHAAICEYMLHGPCGKEKTPDVERLQYHLPDEQCVVFDNYTFIDEVVEKSSIGVSQFLNWMGCNSSEQRDIEIIYAPICFISALQLTHEELKNYALMDIENSLQLNGSSLTRFEGMPLPDSSTTAHHRNTLVMDALSYDRQSLREENERQLSSMTDEQRSLYNEIMDADLNNRGGVFFVYGYGGTGKTFFWRSLCAGIRSKGEIVVAVASSGIAATLIPGGVTAQSRLSIQLNVNEDSTCPRIKPGGDLTELLIRAKLIIWDEAPMTHKYSFEVVDKSLKYVMRVVNERNVELPFGGKVVVFGEIFDKLCRLCPKEVEQTLCVLRLTKNMHLQVGSSSDNVDDIRKFSEWILKIGDGVAGGENDGEVDLEFPDDLLIQRVEDPIASLVNVMYPYLQRQLWNPDYLQERAILAPTHEIVEAVNDYVLSKIDEDEAIYLSFDEVCNDDRGMGDPDLHSLYRITQQYQMCRTPESSIEVEGRCYGDASQEH
ncbi:uncharacterized protein LOC141628995 [Silene latifolia]|uniref:uncharacterized protein LOC141628995 n=1 Tax=Silene latifolia TaxID=37657 RepID=UPI003D7789AC